MTKKIIKIILCATAIFGIVISVVYTASNTPMTAFLNPLWSSSLGLYTNSKNETFEIQTKKPYTYINIPKSADVPIGLIDNKPYEPDNNDPPSTTEETQQQKQETDQPVSNGFPIVALDMSEKQTKDKLLCKNDSKYSPDVNELAKSEYPIKYSKQVFSNGADQPVVLIVHTHGTECYMPENTSTYTSDTPTRTQDKNNNVVAVGKVLADTLNDCGVPTIHCETMFDAQSYSDSYNLSEKAVIEYIKKYPSIQYVFDVHRDSIVRENNEKIKTLSLIDNTPTAQAMFVVGTDSGGADHPNWTNNLTVASIFQYRLVEKYGTLMRPINIRYASFNAEHAPGSILIEIGTCGNTLSEAKNCANLLGKTISEIILNDGL